jgi:phytoene desaturase
MTNVAIIGSGFSGLSTACFLAKAGLNVTIYEQHDTAGGRARKFTAKGFSFDMGPSWYWMPDVFEKFFANFSKKPSDYYTLQRLDPSYRIVFSQQEQLDIPAKLDALLELLETLEPDSAPRFRQFMADSKFKYEVGMQQYVYKPGISITEFMDWKLLQQSMKLDIFRSFTTHIRKYFKHPQILQWLEFPILFLGAKPANTPALYSLMNYADTMLGTWYPQGGMHKIIEGMVSLATELGVQFKFNTRITNLNPLWLMMSLFR